MTSAGRVLVVDDDEACRDITRRCVEAFGHTAQVASSSDEALRMIQSMPPDVVLLDLIMPGGSGLDLLERLKAAENTRGIPVIIVSGQAEMTDRVSVLAAGADDVVEKPCAPAELFARITAVLRRKAERDEMARRNSDLEAEVCRLSARA